MNTEWGGWELRTGLIHGGIVLHARDIDVHLHTVVSRKGLHPQKRLVYLEDILEAASSFFKHNLNILNGLLGAVGH